MCEQKRYVDVILPLKLRGELTYGVPDGSTVEVGQFVVATIKRRAYLGVVSRVGDLPDAVDPKWVVDIEEVKSLKSVSQTQINLWRDISQYYMCSVGELFKCAYPDLFFKQIQKRTTKRRKREIYENSTPSSLSKPQLKSYEEILDAFALRKPVLLNGVTGSGKTEIYIKLALDTMEQGKNVLYLVPEIALSNQLERRLGSVFGDSLLVWHSRQGASKRREVYDKIQSADSPYIILGTRSAVLLPFENLGLIVVDEEHDSSYKQSDPAPRYNGRDVSLMISHSQGANIILGSATPSLEALYNVSVGKFVKVDLLQKFHGAVGAECTIIDMNEAYRLHNVRGSFSMKLVNMISNTLKSGEQALIFRSRRAYSSYMQCSQCGDVAKCPRCNVALTYHKHNNSMQCHYCGYQRPFSLYCKQCGGENLLRGNGTERLEEELSALFPEARVARFDAQSTSSSKEQNAMIKGFESGELDIMVGTQMLSKGFDFAKLRLVAVISGDSLVCQEDFRADERALALLSQLRGRCGRRDLSGEFVIQSFQPNYPVFRAMLIGEDGFEKMQQTLLDERREFSFPPFVRMVSITLKDRYEDRLLRSCDCVRNGLISVGVDNFIGPAVPSVDRVGNRYIRVFRIHLLRNSRAATVKLSISAMLQQFESENRGKTEISIDVDPI